MSEFKEVIKQYKYMCDSMDTCNECPLYPKDLLVPSCEHFIREYPIKAESIITEWYAKNRPMTNAEKIQQIFGLELPPVWRGCYGKKCPNDNQSCVECPYENFWEQEYKENK